MLLSAGPCSDSLWDRVWAKVRIAGLDECWHWTGAKSLKRRGRRPVIQLGGRGSKVYLVARIVCEWYQGAPPTPDHEAGHTCPLGECGDCVNPRHLVWMTRVENEHHKQTYRVPDGIDIAAGTAGL